jgi:hypothetical protein
VKILMRSRRSPFEAISARRTYRHNAIGDNVGNLMFSDATHRVMSTEGTEIDSNRFGSRPEDADKINETYDAFVVPLANAFRPSFQEALDRLSELIEKLTIPVVVVGVGAQAGINYDPTRLGGIEASVKRFVAAVLDRSATIGVRGDFTAEYLAALGFSDVDVIGCPSLFLRGPDLEVQKRLPGLSRSSKVTLNVSPYVQAMGAITMANYERYPDLLYIAQDLRTLGVLLHGDEAEDVGKRSPIPIYSSHPLYQEGKIRFPLSSRSWLDLLATRDFSFGTRIHGTIASLMAGTPAVLLAHDSRTLELARYHEIPYRLIKDISPDVDPAQLYDEVDFSRFNGGHRQRFIHFSDFMARNGLPHVYTDGKVDPGAAAFDAQLAEVKFPPPVRPAGPPSAAQREVERTIRRGRRVLGRVARRTGLRRR